MTSIRDTVYQHVANGCEDPRCDLKDTWRFCEHLIEELEKSPRVDGHNKYYRVVHLVEKGWRPIPAEAISASPLEAFSAGRNWMIDAIRGAIAGEDISVYYPFQEDPRDEH